MNKLSAYHKIQDMALEDRVMNSNPVELIVILMDGLLSSMRVEPGNDFRNPNQPLEIISELSESLNHDAFPELADNLQSLYEYWTREILLYRVSRETVHLDNIIPSITTLRYAWAEISKNEQANPLLPSEPIS